MCMVFFCSRSGPPLNFHSSGPLSISFEHQMGEWFGTFELLRLFRINRIDARALMGGDFGGWLGRGVAFEIIGSFSRIVVVPIETHVVVPGTCVIRR